jgi:hypothetical protein
MQRKKPDVDIIKDILTAAQAAYPGSDFVKSLAYQYEERGGLSKKQLQGLYHKAVKVKTITPAKLATLEAVILKKTAKYRSPLPTNAPLFTKDTRTGEMITTILEKNPGHKRVLFFKMKYENNEILSAPELAELEKFYKLFR